MAADLPPPSALRAAARDLFSRGFAVIRLGSASSGALAVERARGSVGSILLCAPEGEGPTSAARRLAGVALKACPSAVTDRLEGLHETESNPGRVNFFYRGQPGLAREPRASPARDLERARADAASAALLDGAMRDQHDAFLAGRALAAALAFEVGELAEAGLGPQLRGFAELGADPGAERVWSSLAVQAYRQSQPAPAAGGDEPRGAAPRYVVLPHCDCTLITLVLPPQGDRSLLVRDLASHELVCPLDGVPSDDSTPLIVFGGHLIAALPPLYDRGYSLVTEHAVVNDVAPCGRVSLVYRCIPGGDCDLGLGRSDELKKCDRLVHDFRSSHESVTYDK